MPVSITCKGLCHSTGQDEVTCKILNLNRTYVFNDICDGRRNLFDGPLITAKASVSPKYENGYVKGVDKNSFKIK